MESLELKHRPLIEDYLQRFPPEISEHTFANLFVWRHSRPIRVLETDGSLILLAGEGSACTIFGPPLGTISLAHALDAARAATPRAVIAIELIPESRRDELRAAGLDPCEDRDNFDYVYRREDLAFLHGRNYHNKRNLIAQALADYDCTYESITHANLPQVIELQHRWCAARRCGETPHLCHEFIATSEALNNFEALGLTGGAVRIGGRLEAYTVAQALTPATAVIHFEKAMLEFKGLYQVINRWCAEHELGTYEYINREQDLGVAGLRQAKESYFPHHMVKKYFAPIGMSREDYLKMRTVERRC